MSIIKCIKQWAGRGSTQVSVGTIINNGTGLTSKDVQKISREEAIKVLNEVSEPARQIGANRADEFSGIVLNKLTDSDNLNSLHDPAMLAALSQAYNTAICTDNKTDYEILSELLAYRAEHPNNKNATAIFQTMRLMLLQYAMPSRILLQNHHTYEKVLKK